VQKSSSGFIYPNRLLKDNGETRKVGYELEFAGLEIDSVIDIVARALNAEKEQKSQAEYLLHSDTLGKFKIELDWQFAKQTAAERAASHGQTKEEDKFTHWLTKVASQVVPVEIVCPPIAIEHLEQLEPVVKQLSESGALGTDESVFYAFGVHINPELPDLSPATIAQYIKAYAIAQNWLVKAHKIDPIRRVTPYIDLYPDEYIKAVLAYDESISLKQIIQDYLEFNPTRNRGLDLLPLFKYLEPEIIESNIKDDRINARPTFHYRLPNCEIDRSKWSLSESWNVWCVIESLAQRESVLNELTQQWLDYQSTLKLKTEPWHTILDQLHQNLLSA